MTRHVPPIPEGFTLETPPIPQGFTLEQAPVTAAAPKSLGVMDFLPSAEHFNQFFYGANERLADVYTLPGDLASAFLKTIRAPGLHEPTQDYVTKFLRKGQEYPPQTRGQRIARRAGEEVGATLPYAAFPYVAPATRAVGPAKNLAGRTVRAITEGIQGTPARAGIGEAVAATGAGLGAGVAQEVAPDSMLAEVTGQLAGGLAPSAAGYTPVIFAARMARQVAKRFSPGMQTAAAKHEVGRVIGDQMGPEAEANLVESARLSSEIPGFDPTLA